MGTVRHEMTWLGWLNALVFQWFGVRLQRHLSDWLVERGGPQRRWHLLTPSTVGWSLLVGVLPCSGWRDSRYIGPCWQVRLWGRT